MPDPLRFVYVRPDSGLRGVNLPSTSGQLFYRDGLHHAAYLIAKHEPRVWFEPNWRNARVLARQFPHCLICSIPEESDTPSLHKIPGWRKSRLSGIL